MAAAGSRQQAHGLVGAWAPLADLVALRQRVRHLRPAGRRKATAPRPGNRSSRLPGRGIDFAEVRNYVPGDDVRNIDWRVTARKGRPHTKLFQEEREHPVLVLADQRPAMFLGSHRRMKSVAAAELATLLLWAALERGDRSGALLLGSGGHRAFRPRHSRSAVLHVLHGLSDYSRTLADAAVGAEHAPAPRMDGEAEPLAASLERLRRIVRPGSYVFVLSDFHDFDAAAQRALHLAGRHLALTCVLISDPLERELPQAARYALKAGDERLAIDTAHTATRADYRARFTQRLASVQDACRQARLRCLHAGTESDLESIAAEALR